MFTRDRLGKLGSDLGTMQIMRLSTLELDLPYCVTSLDTSSSPVIIIMIFPGMLH